LFYQKEQVGMDKLLIVEVELRLSKPRQKVLWPKGVCMEEQAAASSQPTEQLKRISSAWWLLMLVGFVAVAAGVIVLVQPGISLTSLAVVAGIFLLVEGVYELFSSFSKKSEHRGTLAVLGVISVIAGLLLVRHPIGGVVAISLFLGIWLVAFGLVRLVGSFDDTNRAWNLLVAVVAIIAGVLIVANPTIAVSTLGLIVGIAFVVRGVGLVAEAWTFHGLKQQLSPTHKAAPSH
jgi:uncharacterized membrane protein HdeD (DUF308 family)